MYNASKETNVRFLRAALAYVQEQLLVEKKRNLELMTAKVLDEELCRTLSEELLLLRKKFFAGGRERRVGKPTVKRTANKENLPHNRPPIVAPEADGHELEVEEIVHDLDDPACPGCNAFMREMSNGTEESCEIHVVEHRYILRRHKRQKYVCKKCNKIIAAKGPEKLTPGGSFSIQMAAKIADDKFHRHLPLNRQAQEMAENGLTVDTKTLFSLTEHLASRLKQVPGLIKAEVLSRPFVCIDESPMKILSTDQNGFVWSTSNNYGAYYQYETTRSGKVAGEMLAGYSGAVMCDGYQGYDFLEEVQGIVLVHCWAHCRRRFYDAIKDYPEAEAAVGMIDELYEIEREAEDLEHLSQLRKERARPVVDRLEAYLEGRRGSYLASGLFGKAVQYFEERRPQLKRFLNDANIPLDNNAAERSQRDPVMGRNNYLGFRTINGADVAMTFYCIVRSCKIVGLSPKQYMIVMATRSARGEKVMTPYQWASYLHTQAENEVNQVVEKLF